ILRKTGDAEADGDRPVREGVLLDHGADAVRVRDAAGLRRVHEDDRELVTAVPRHDAEAARMLHEELGDVTQRLIAGSMAEPVVDLLEVIEAHEGQPERLPHGPRAVRT